jgi:integrase
MTRKNLKQRNLSWYARLKVPRRLQAAVGRQELIRALGTRDLAEANRRKHAVLAAMQEELSRAEAGALVPRESAEYLLETAKELREAVRNGETTDADAEAALDAALENHLEKAARRHGRDTESGHPLLPEDQERVLKLAFTVLHTGDVDLLSQAVKDYLAEKAPHINRQTAREKERHLGEFQKYLKGDCEAGSVTRKIAGRYVTERLLKKGHAPKTVKDTLSNLSAFWRWLVKRGLAEFNVWEGMGESVRGSSRGTEARRRPWTDAEVLKLLEGIPTNDPLWSLCAIGAYTGARREEISRLKVADVSEDGALEIREGKTQAAVRRIPIHPAIAPLIEQLKSTSPDGYLIPGLLTGGADGKRGHYLGKRFTAARRKLGLNNSATVFHSFRKALAQRCEDAEVPESTIELIGGWSRGKRMSYGVYSPGAKFEVLRKAIAKATYGAADAVVMRLGKSAAITTRSRRRHKRT